MADNVDLTLDEMRPILAERLVAHVPFDGWSDKALCAAATECGINVKAARLAFKGGANAMVEAWLDLVDKQMVSALDTYSFRSLPVRRKIAQAVQTRLKLAEPNRETVRRAVAVLAMPSNAFLAFRRSWKTADAMWVAAGDSSTDLNYYSKRSILASIYTATLLIWIDDDSEDHSTTWQFLDRRIDNVMQFEKLKASFRNKVSSANGPSISRFLGRLRYPVDQQG